MTQDQQVFYTIVGTIMLGIPMLLIDGVGLGRGRLWASRMGLLLGHETTTVEQAFPETLPSAEVLDDLDARRNDLVLGEYEAAVWVSRDRIYFWDFFVRNDVRDTVHSPFMRAMGIPVSGELEISRDGPRTHLHKRVYLRLCGLGSSLMLPLAFELALPLEGWQHLALTTFGAFILFRVWRSRKRLDAAHDALTAELVERARTMTSPGEGKAEAEAD
ncbi:hypothetical protein G6O69_33020 [Pseudenhygromyxa sp. WMMC2535]|uniref:hypothetical protein n=1 Tax=Pseudenhygromyxa sp. WMMC2535 TaxID=2712867 RepID=UPI0015520BF2|nr:hypothetical protein [Pseudenhygromyxa sp. WMMC2535]NVB42691.1 hypothetical protein [Pseudenhygromyxa sp. WMMC2535]